MDEPEQRSIWSRLLVRLFREYKSECLYHQAELAAREWFDARPEGGWPFEVIPFWDQFEILCLLNQRQDRTRRQRFAGELTELARKQLDFTPGSDAVRQVSAALWTGGDIDLAEGDRQAARRKYEESLKISRWILSEYGPDLEALRDLCVLLLTVGDIDLAEGDRQAARAKYVESLKISRSHVYKYGPDVEALRDLSYDRLGKLRLHEPGETSG